MQGGMRLVAIQVFSQKQFLPVLDYSKHLAQERLAWNPLMSYVNLSNYWPVQYISMTNNN